MRHNEPVRIEEYKFLRQEHENNRKFIFERPLIIVIGMVAAFLGFKGTNNEMIGLLPSLFLAVLWFNIWFTFNRMQSSARVVTYIQRWHEGDEPAPWIGWENSLELFRRFIHEKREEVRSVQRSVHVSDSMGFYLQIFYFHAFCGIAFIPIALFQCGTITCAMGTVRVVDSIWIPVNLLAVVSFMAMLYPYRPSKVRRPISVTRGIWDRVLPRNEALPTT